MRLGAGHIALGAAAAAVLHLAAAVLLAPEAPGGGGGGGGRGEIVVGLAILDAAETPGVEVREQAGGPEAAGAPPEVAEASTDQPPAPLAAAPQRPERRLSEPPPPSEPARIDASPAVEAPGAASSSAAVVESAPAEAAVEADAPPGPDPGSAAARRAPPPVARPEPLREAQSTVPREPRRADAERRPLAEDATIAPAAAAFQPPSSAPAGAGAAGGDAAGGAALGGAGLPPPASAGLKRRYVAELQSWIARHQRYPRQARLRRQEGEGLLRFRIDSGGRLLGASLQRSSGHGALDEEILAMIRRAAPLPPIPDGLQLSNLELVLPVSFTLR